MGIKGKKVLNHYYWHESLLSQQPSHVQAHVAQAIDLASLEVILFYAVWEDYATHRKSGDWQFLQSSQPCN